MKEEKEIVLQLLEEGKISREEAMKLYEGLNKAEKPPKKNVIDEGIKKASDIFGKATETVSGKYKEIEPTVKEKSKEVYSKAQETVSNIHSKFEKNEINEEDIINHDDFTDIDAEEFSEDIINDEDEK